jgi:mannonate dehydratase
MIESWRSYGPLDMITLPEVAQNRANGIVTALHEILFMVSEVRTVGYIRARQALIGERPDLGLNWIVTESLPVHEGTKRR